MGKKSKYTGVDSVWVAVRVERVGDIVVGTARRLVLREIGITERRFGVAAGKGESGERVLLDGWLIVGGVELLKVSR